MRNWRNLVTVTQLLPIPAGNTVRFIVLLGFHLIPPVLLLLEEVLVAGDRVPLAQLAQVPRRRHGRPHFVRHRLARARRRRRAANG